jgi:hypothetical protein
MAEKGLGGRDKKRLSGDWVLTAFSQVKDLKYRRRRRRRRVCLGCRVKPQGLRLYGE